MDEIFELGAASFGKKQAEKYLRTFMEAFALIGEYPKLAQERPEVKSGFRFHPVGAHLVIYTIDDRGVLIVRVCHAHEDWMNDTA